MVLPLILGVVGAVASGFVFGKTGSGGTNLEVGTSKKNYSSQDTFTSSSVYSPTINRSFDIQYNIASEGSTISTKKESSVSQTPTTSPLLNIIPSTIQGGGQLPTSSNSGLGINFYDIAIFGALGVGAYILIKRSKK